MIQRRYLLAIALFKPVLLIGFLPALLPAQDTFSYLVKIHGTKKPGSGFVVALENDIATENNIATIVTASHVIMGTEEFKVAFANAPEHLYRVNSATDLVGMEPDSIHGLAAFLVRDVPPDRVAPLPLDVQTELSIQDRKPLEFIGFPNRSISPQRFSGLFAGRNGSLILLDRPAGAGASGSPLMHDGKAIGLMTATEAQNSLAVNAGAIQDILQGWDVVISGVSRSAASHDTGSGQALESTIILEERFDDNKNLWQEFFLDKEARGVIKGGQLLLGSRHNEWRLMVIPIILQPDIDFLIRCKAAKKSGADSAFYGLAWGVKDFDNFFSFTITSSKHVTVFKKEKGELTPYEHIYPSAAERFFNSSGINDLSVQGRAGRLRFYINGRLVYERAMESFFGQYLGFVVFNKVQIVFDDLVVTSSMRPATSDKAGGFRR